MIPQREEQIALQGSQTSFHASHEHSEQKKSTGSSQKPKSKDEPIKKSTGIIEKTSGIAYATSVQSKEFDSKENI